MIRLPFLPSSASTSSSRHHKHIKAFVYLVHHVEVNLCVLQMLVWSNVNVIKEVAVFIQNDSLKADNKGDLYMIGGVSSTVYNNI